MLSLITNSKEYLSYLMFQQLSSKKSSQTQEKGTEGKKNHKKIQENYEGSIS